MPEKTYTYEQYLRRFSPATILERERERQAKETPEETGRRLAEEIISRFRNRVGLIP